MFGVRKINAPIRTLEQAVADRIKTPGWELRPDAQKLMLMYLAREFKLDFYTLVAQGMMTDRKDAKTRMLQWTYSAPRAA